MHYIKPFDPWKSPLCTCPPKYSFNPYTGCVHNCVYCYATYIPRFHQLRLKKDLFRRLRKDLEKLSLNALISMSNSSDPYPPAERSLEITRRCLEIMKDYDIRLLVVTKSDIVARDVDLLSEMRCAVSITITCLSDSIAKKIEPNAPKPRDRIEALKNLKDAGIPVLLRLDPIIPFLTESEAVKVIEACDFVDHVVTSTLKLRKDILARFAKVFPELAERYKKIYTEKVGSYKYLPKELRLRILKQIADKCEELGIGCAFCREGFGFDAGSCDGSHLIE
jgi:DNA repair photolyase